MPTRYHGIYPVLYAYFDAAGRLHEASMRAQVEHCIAAGAHGICVLGLVTEVNRLATEGRLELVEMVGRQIGGRVPYAVTVGEPTVAGQIAFCRAAKAAGADWVILQPPPPSDEGGEQRLIDFFLAVAHEVDLPIAIQNNPVNLATWLSVDGLIRVVNGHENIRLLKAEGWSVDIAQVIAGVGDGVDAFGGHGGIEFLSLLRSGGAGLIPAPDCLALQVRLYELYRQGTAAALAEAEAIHRELLPLIVFMTRNVRGLVYYGKRLYARQAGIDHVHDLPGGIVPNDFGMEEMERLVARLIETGARFLPSR